MVTATAANAGLTGEIGRCANKNRTVKTDGKLRCGGMEFSPHRAENCGAAEIGQRCGGAKGVAWRDCFGGVTVPQTEGVKYAGSKLKLLPYILAAAVREDVRTVLDAFSGTTRVAQAFAQTGLETTANDRAVWSETFGRCYLTSSKPDAYYAELIEHLNHVKGYDGWFTEHYGGEDVAGKRPFRCQNTQKLDGVRDEIDRLALDADDKSVALTSLMLALDAVDNTLGHFAAYLAGWSERSMHEMMLRLPRRFERTARTFVEREDVFEAVRRPYDLVYLDPPYGSNNEKMPPSRVRYAAYYHFWTTVVLNDRPAVFGRANRREDSRDTVAPSVFEQFRKSADGRFVAMEAIDRLIGEANAHYVLLSYSSGGRATKEELYDIINRHGRLVSAREIDYRRNVMAALTWTGEWARSEGEHKEYLFLMEKM